MLVAGWMQCLAATPPGLVIALQAFDSWIQFSLKIAFSPGLMSFGSIDLPSSFVRCQQMCLATHLWGRLRGEAVRLSLTPPSTFVDEQRVSSDTVEF